MLGFLSLGKVRLALLIGAVVAIAAVIGWLAWDNYTLSAQRDSLLQENGAQRTAIEVQQQTIDDAVGAIEEWREQMTRLQGQLTELARVQQEATSETRRLNDVFARHDLARLARARPGLVERRVNSGTADALRMLEVASGGGSDKQPRD